MNRSRLAVAWIATVAVAYATGSAWAPVVRPVGGAGKYFPVRGSDAGPGKWSDAQCSREERLRRTLAQQFKPGRLADMARLLDGATTEEMRSLADLMAAKREMPSIPGRLLLVRWGAIDGPAALAWLKADMGRHSNPQDFSAIISGWASRDPQSAMNWLRTADPRETNVDFLLHGTLTGWAQKDLSAMTSWLIDPKHVPSFNPENYAAELTRTIFAGRGVGEYLTWMEGLQNRPETPNEFIKVAFESARDILVSTNDVESAVAFLSRSASQPWCKTEDVERVLWSVCDRQPDKVLEASVQLGPDPKTGKFYLAEEAITTWCERNPAAAARWLQNRTDSPIYGECAPVVEKFLAEKDAAAEARGQESSTP